MSAGRSMRGSFFVLVCSEAGRARPIDGVSWQRGCRSSWPLLRGKGGGERCGGTQRTDTGTGSELLRSCSPRQATILPPVLGALQGPMAHGVSSRCFPVTVEFSYRSPSAEPSHRLRHLPCSNPLPPVPPSWRRHLCLFENANRRSGTSRYLSRTSPLRQDLPERIRQQPADSVIDPGPASEVWAGGGDVPVKEHLSLSDHKCKVLLIDEQKRSV